MSAKPLIDIIKDELQNYSGIDLEQPTGNKLLIYVEGENVINIALIVSDSEYQLFFNEYSRHFDKSEDDCETIMDQIIACLSGNLRLEIYSKNGYPFKWKLQIKDSHQNWQNYGTTAIMTLNFWVKSTVHYLQNDSINLIRSK